jgi:hypothetical protein
MSLIWALIILEKEIAERYLDILEYDDVGKPLRIKDPNADMAYQAFMNNNKEISFVKMSGDPPPTMFARGYYETEQAEEIQNMFGSGWRIL